MNTLFAISFITTITIFTLTATALETATPSPSSSPPGGCADSVISFSPCLPYISAPPNDLSNEPSSQCCDIFNESLDTGDAECLCYLVRQTTLLGFPLNASKLLSLSDLCSFSSSSNVTRDTLDSICSDSQTLPPLIDTTKKPHPGSISLPRSPPPLLNPLHPAPPSTITKPGSANNASTQNTTKPSAANKSNNGSHLTLANPIALMPIYLLLVQILISISDQFTAGMEY